MKYYLDTEFVEGPQDKRLLGIKYGETKPTIDLISIGIVPERKHYFPEDLDSDIVKAFHKSEEINKREYYAISKDFNLKQAWKNEWIRFHVLSPIFKELAENDPTLPFHAADFRYKHLRYLINKFGKTNKQIAKEIIEFLGPEQKRYSEFGEYTLPTPEFWAYYADYDWIVFCQLFGRMVDLPDGFPKYCRDLKQELDNKVKALKGERVLHYLKEKRSFNLDGIETTSVPATKTVDFDKMSFEDKLNLVKNEIYSYPKQESEHNALADAKWNRELHKFLKYFI